MPFTSSPLSYGTITVYLKYDSSVITAGGQTPSTYTPTGGLIPIFTNAEQVPTMTVAPHRPVNEAIQEAAAIYRVPASAVLDEAGMPKLALHLEVGGSMAVAALDGGKPFHMQQVRDGDTLYLNVV